MMQAPPAWSIQSLNPRRSANIFSIDGRETWLRVKSAVAGTATTQKRFTPKARGSAGPILKRTCHIKIVLSDE